MSFGVTPWNSQHKMMVFLSDGARWSCLIFFAQCSPGHLSGAKIAMNSDFMLEKNITWHWTDGSWMNMEWALDVQIWVYTPGTILNIPNGWYKPSQDGRFLIASLTLYPMYNWGRIWPYIINDSRIFNEELVDHPLFHGRQSIYRFTVLEDLEDTSYRCTYFSF
jgi:hypothetical protein